MALKGKTHQPHPSPSYLSLHGKEKGYLIESAIAGTSPAERKEIKRRAGKKESAYGIGGYGGSHPRK